MNASVPAVNYACPRYHCPAGSNSQVRSHRPCVVDYDRDLGHQCRRRQGNICRILPMAFMAIRFLVAGTLLLLVAWGVERSLAVRRRDWPLLVAAAMEEPDSISRCFSRACR